MQSTILSVVPDARNHGAKVDIYPINTYFTFMKKGRALLHKCFALNVPGVSYDGPLLNGLERSSLCSYRSTCTETIGVI